MEWGMVVWSDECSVERGGGGETRRIRLLNYDTEMEA